MKDWNAYRNELGATLGKIAEISPDILRANDLISNAAPAEPKLDAKTRELIALAVAVTTRCDGCIAFHAEGAAKAGATKADLVEALSIAIALNSGAALIYSARAFDALEQSSK